MERQVKFMDVSQNEKKIVIWGAGQSGVKTLELLEHYGVEIHAFLESRSCF